MRRWMAGLEVKIDADTRVTAGVATWTPDLGTKELIAPADRALLHAKQEGGRGRAIAFSALSQLPATLRDQRVPAPAPAADNGAWPEPHRIDERLRKRTRQLALANALGARLSAMTEPEEIFEAAVEELHQAFGYYMCAVIRIRDDDRVEAAAGRGRPFEQLLDRRWSQPRDHGLIGRCLRERRPLLVNDVHADPTYNSTPETSDVRSELVVPLWVGEALWGTLNIEEVRPEAFDQDDLRLVETVADQVGSALRSATLYEQLERAYLGTAEALAAALEAKDAYTAEHARSIVEQAEAVGRRLGLDDGELRDLRFGAVFHDIGKIAIPEAILNKRGPLDDDERRVMERHTLIGEQILAPTSSSPACGASSATSTSAGTAPATRTGWRATTSPSRRGSSSPATRCTR